jgi:hypothetical protein
MGEYFTPLWGYQNTMFNWFNRSKKTEQPTDSLENITEQNTSIGRRAFLAGSLAFLAGCAAPGFRAILDRDKEHAAEMEKHELGGTAEEFAKENLQEIMKATKVEPYQTPDALKKAVQSRYSATKDDDYITAFSELAQQNQYLADLFNSAKIRRYTLRSVKRNADYDGLEQYASMTQRDIDKLKETLSDLSTSIRRLDFAKRQKLEKAFGKNKQFKDMLDYNKNSLEVLNKLFISAADLDTLEGNLQLVVDANAYSSDIQKSLTGLDQSDDDRGRGKKLLDKLLDEHTFSEVVSPDTDVASEYSAHGSNKIRVVYNELLGKIGAEAASWDAEESLHTVCNDYLAKMLEITKEAYVRGKFKDPSDLKNKTKENERFQAVNRVVTRDALYAVKEKLNTERGLNVLYDVGLSILPGYSLIAAIFNARRALSKDDCEPEAQDPAAAHAELIRKGKHIKYGFATRDFIAGTNYTARVRFYSGIASTAAQVGLGLLLWQAGKKDSSSGSAPAQQVEIYGGETGSPGVGPN